MMDLDKEILRRLKVEVAALEAELNKKERQIIDREAEHRLLIAAALKFGTMVAPGTMVMSLPYSVGSVDTYDVTITNHPERNERTVRVRRA